MNGVPLSPRKSREMDAAEGGEGPDESDAEEEEEEGGEGGFDGNFCIDDSLDEPVGGRTGSEGSDGAGDLPVPPAADDADAHADFPSADSAARSGSSSMEDVAIDAAPEDNDVALASGKPSEGEGDATPFEGGGASSVRSSDGEPPITAFESLYRLSPATAWRLRSAYAPTSPAEAHLASLGSDVWTLRRPAEADAILAGLEVARECEARTCDVLRRIGELIGYGERRKGTKLAAAMAAAEKTGVDFEEEGDDEMEAAEALFAYFCEKNAFPMLVDALACRPPRMTSSSPERAMGGGATDGAVGRSAAASASGSPPSPFSGVAWTAPVKGQILRTIAQILFNTSHPLSATYLLSNDYANELVEGILPLSQWKDDALEEILPPYATLLRGLAMRLRADEGKASLPLFLRRRPAARRRDAAAPGGGGGGARGNPDDDGASEPYFPLLHAAVRVFCSPFGTSLRDGEGCSVRVTATNVILNLCRIADPEVRRVLIGGGGGGEGG
ncbi:hypothetical protein ACHAWF_003678, partial [Thalassiosira exigua]